MDEIEINLFTDTESDGEQDNSSVFVTDETFLTRIKEKSKYVSNILDIHEEVALQCLAHTEWDSDKLISSFTQNKEQLLKEIGLTEENLHEKQGFHNGNTNELQTCEICFCDYPQNILLALPCDHYFCRECWINHIRFSINQGINLIHCMHQDCFCEVILPDIIELVGASLASKLERRIAASTVCISNTVKRCINPNCQLSLSVDSIGLCGIAKCKCGTRMCWICGGEAHAPLACNLIEKWQSTTDSGNKSHWVVQNTKPCMKCGARIEKDGGCNHMTCRSCGFQFCWICGHEWATHKGEKYKCNQYIDLNGIGSEQSRQIARLDHYCQRFFDHQDAKARENENKQKFVKKMEKIFLGEFSRTEISENERKTIDFVLDVRDNARSVLMWSYPYAYMLKSDSSELKLFEFVQSECEKSCERLCFMLENIIPSTHKLVQCAKLLEKNTELVLKHVDEH